MIGDYSPPIWGKLLCSPVHVCSTNVQTMFFVAVFPVENTFSKQTWKHTLLVSKNFSHNLFFQKFVFEYCRVTRPKYSVALSCTITSTLPLPAWGYGGPTTTVQVDAGVSDNVAHRTRDSDLQRGLFSAGNCRGRRFLQWTRMSNPIQLRRCWQ